MGRREIQQRKSERDLQKKMALNLSKRYCQEHGLSFEKLKKQTFEFINGIAFFMQPSEVVPNGLLNDMETMPMPTLILKIADDDIVFEQTEYTKKYLS